MKISFVIPCYRSERTIEGVVAEIKSVVAQRPEVDYEVIMVSDHSPDDVYSVIEQMCKADPKHLRGVELARNFGQQGALMAGYSKIDGDVVFSLDDDGQAPVDSIFKLIDKLIGEGCDIVYGTYPVKKHSFFRNVGSEINLLMARWLIGLPRGLRASSFFVARRFIVDEIRRYDGPFPYLGGLIFRTTKNVGAVEVAHRVRVEGTSGYTFGKLLALWFNGFTAFSVKPLRFASVIGLCCAMLGFSGVVWTIFNKIFLHSAAPVGYSSVMSVVLFVGGMLMLLLGLIGEYVGRIYISLNKSPQFVVRKETGN